MINSKRTIIPDIQFQNIGDATQLVIRDVILGFAEDFDLADWHFSVYRAALEPGTAISISAPDGCTKDRRCPGTFEVGPCFDSFLREQYENWQIRNTPPPTP
jgi:hypothetical protein